MITTDNITIHELIGLKTEVVDSSNTEIIGMKGTIIDETKSMFTINTKNGFKKIPKSNSRWQFSLDSKYVLDGSKIAKRPHERLKKA